jgi:hypothetical protein
MVADEDPDGDHHHVYTVNETWAAYVGLAAAGPLPRVYNGVSNFNTFFFVLMPK